MIQWHRHYSLTNKYGFVLKYLIVRDRCADIRGEGKRYTGGIDRQTKPKKR